MTVKDIIDVYESAYDTIHVCETTAGNKLTPMSNRNYLFTSQRASSIWRVFYDRKVIGLNVDTGGKLQITLLKEN